MFTYWEVIYYEWDWSVPRKNERKKQFNNSVSAINWAIYVSQSSNYEYVSTSKWTVRPKGVELVWKEEVVDF